MKSKTCPPMTLSVALKTPISSAAVAASLRLIKNEAHLKSEFGKKFLDLFPIYRNGVASTLGFITNCLTPIDSKNILQL